MSRTLSAVIVGVMLTAIGSVAAEAQDLKAMLLKPANGWVIEWSNPTTQDKGVTTAVFEDRGGKIVAKLHLAEMGQQITAFRDCERDVAITADTISFDGCRDQNVVLIRDSGDKVYPLKTKAQTFYGYDWKLKEK